MSRLLDIRLLGTVELRLGGTPLAPPGSAPAVSLLAYLLLHRGMAHPRQRLAFLLWPDSGEAQARTNLRKALHTLRRALPGDGFLDVGAQTLGWRADAPYRLDVAEFEHALAAADLRAAVDAYGGDLVDGSYDEWILAERERLRDRCADALEQLAGYPDGLEHAERLVRLDPLREAGHRALMRLHAARGDRVRAMRAYHAYAALAQRELGIVPSAELRMAYEELIEARPPAPSASRALLVGRAAERDRLRAVWDAARRGHPQLVLVTGEPGIGKSRLVEDLRATCGAASAEARAYAAEGAVAYGPVAAWLRSDAIAPRLRRAPAAEMSRLLPELGEASPSASAHGGERPSAEPTRAEASPSASAHGGARPSAEPTRAEASPSAVAHGGARPSAEPTRADASPSASAHGGARASAALPGRAPAEAPTSAPLSAPTRAEAPPSAPLSEAEQRTRLFAAVARTLLAPGTPLLLVADDLQWFDVPTLQFLHYLLRSTPPAPLLVAATARREELDPGHPLSELVTGLQALGRCSEIALGRLSRAETAELAAQAQGAPLDAPQAERLFAASEGNPLYLVEAAQAGAEAGGRVQAMIAARLARLTAPASELAGVAATIGREFSAPVLADASDVDARAFVVGLDELWRRGIVRAHEHDLYDFSHGRIREAAYERLGPAQRRAQHLRVARALERAGADAGLLAAQYEAAGALDDAYRHYVHAAGAAQRLYDHAGAVRALERALALTTDPEHELELLTALPAPLNALDGYRSERLERVHERGFELARVLGVEPEAPLVRSRAVAALTGGDFPAARGAAEQLRARGEREADDVLLVEAAWILAIADYWSGELEHARRQLETALAYWRPEHRAEHLLHYGQDTELTCRIRLAHTLWLLGDRDAAARTRDAAVADAREHPHTRAIVHVWAALIALDEHDEPALRAHAQVVSEYARGPAERAAQALAGFVAVLDGDHERGCERIRRCADAAEQGEPAAPGERGLLLRILVEAYAVAGDTPAGLEATERALRTSNAAQPWTAEINRLQRAFRAQERFGNGWPSRMAPIPDDLPDHHI